MENQQNNFSGLPGKQRGVSLYYQVEELFRNRIQSGEWPVGYKLPSEPELAAQLNVSRATVRQAIFELVQKGMLVRKQGSGTYVARPSDQGEFISLSYPRELGGDHQLLSSREILCSPFISRTLDIPEGSAINEVCWLRYLGDGTIAALETYYAPQSLAEAITEYDHRRLILEYLQQKCGVNVTRVHNYLEPVLLRKAEAEILNEPPGAPALLVTRLYYTYGERPLYLYNNLIRAEMAKLLRLG